MAKGGLPHRMPARVYPRGWKNVLRNVFRPRVMEFLASRVTDGRNPEDKLARLPLNHYQYPVGSVREVERLGLRLTLDLSDLVDWAIFFGLVDDGLERLFEHTQPNDVVIDVGANNGMVTMRLAQRVGVGGRVFSFEPHPENFRRLEHNLFLNDLPQVSAFPVGLGEALGQASMLSVDKFNLGMHRIVPDRSLGDQPSDTIGDQPPDTIELTTLDSVRERYGLDRLDWVKIDVEGYELKVVRGGLLAIEELRPRLFVEVDDAHLRDQGDSAQALLGELDQLGYTMVDAVTGTPVIPGVGEIPAHFDVLCTPASHRPDANSL